MRRNVFYLKMSFYELNTFTYHMSKLLFAELVGCVAFGLSDIQCMLVTVVFLLHFFAQDHLYCTCTLETFHWADCVPVNVL